MDDRESRTAALELTCIRCLRGNMSHKSGKQII